MAQITRVSVREHANGAGDGGHRHEFNDSGRR
jgi:hypothetical protein